MYNMFMTITDLINYYLHVNTHKHIVHVASTVYRVRSTAHSSARSSITVISMGSV
jgi:hypothetical protein